MDKLLLIQFRHKLSKLQKTFQQLSIKIGKKYTLFDLCFPKSMPIKKISNDIMFSIERDTCQVITINAKYQITPNMAIGTPNNSEYTLLLIIEQEIRWFKSQTDF